MQPDQKELALELIKQGLSISEVTRTFNVHPATIYRSFGDARVGHIDNLSVDPGRIRSIRKWLFIEVQSDRIRSLRKTDTGAFLLT